MVQMQYGLALVNINSYILLYFIAVQESMHESGGGAREGQRCDVL